MSGRWKLELLIWLIYLTYLSDLFIWVTYLSYLSELFIWVIYPSHLFGVWKINFKAGAHLILLFNINIKYYIMILLLKVLKIILGYWEFNFFIKWIRGHLEDIDIIKIVLFYFQFFQFFYKLLSISSTNSFFLNLIIPLLSLNYIYHPNIILDWKILWFVNFWSFYWIPHTVLINFGPLVIS